MNEYLKFAKVEEKQKSFTWAFNALTDQEKHTFRFYFQHFSVNERITSQGKIKLAQVTTKL